jgi:hypothetical protein
MKRAAMLLAVLVMAVLCPGCLVLWCGLYGYQNPRAPIHPRCMAGPRQQQPTTAAASAEEEPRVEDVDGQQNCINDYGCPPGHACLKANYKTSGRCVQKVNEVGVPTYAPPDPGSTAPARGDCMFDTQCPPLFYCAKDGGMYGNCLRRSGDTLPFE